MKGSIGGFIAWAGLVAAVAALGGFASRDAATFYASLERPPWAPPAFVFGPVWTVLYVLMAVAAWRVWKRDGFAKAGLALSLFIAQLVLNGAWSALFFSLHKGAWALIDIAVLWACLAATVLLFRRHDPPASLMLLPYLAWVTFAAVLNFSVWQRNPALLS